MTDNPETLYPLADLPQRYSISRTVVYERINGLGIKLIKSGRRSFLSQADIDRLDELHHHIGQGGTIAAFAHSLPLSADVGLQIPAIGEALIYKAFEALTDANRQRLTDPTWQHERLERCAEQGWILSTAEVKQLIGVKPSGEVLRRGAWEFVKVEKIGRSAGWRVQKRQKAE